MKIRITAIAASIAAASGAASAGTYWVNSPLAPFDEIGGSSAQAKYRLSNTNWDHSVDYGNGTNPGQFIQSGLGNNAQLSARTYDFRFEHIAGEGFISTMTDVTNPQNLGTPSILSWGSFTNPTGGTTTAQLNGFAPGAAFNGLLIEARASRAGSSMSWSNLSFVGGGLNLADGAWASGLVDPSTSGPGDAPGFHYQRLVADTDLSQVDWVFTARVQGVRDSSASGDETVRFVVSAKNYIPTPGAAGVMALVALAGARRRRS